MMGPATRWLGVLSMWMVVALAPGCEQTAEAGAVDPAGPPPSASPVYEDLDGRSHRPLDVGDARCHVLIFITVDCPIANQYSPRIRELCEANKARPVRFFLVHVDPDVDVAAARKHAADYGHVCPVIRDPRHVLVRHTGVTRTPEAAVLDRTGRLRYRGRIDNWYGELGRKRPSPTRHELRDAIRSVLAGEAVRVPRTEAVGCYVPTIK